MRECKHFACPWRVWIQRVTSFSLWGVIILFTGVKKQSTVFYEFCKQWVKKWVEHLPGQEITLLYINQSLYKGLCTILIEIYDTRCNDEFMWNLRTITKRRIISLISKIRFPLDFKCSEYRYAHFQNLLKMVLMIFLMRSQFRFYMSLRCNGKCENPRNYIFV